MSEKKWKVAVITGSLSELGILRPVMRALKDDPAFDLYVVRSEEHADKAHRGGQADTLLKQDGFRLRVHLGAAPVESGDAVLAERRQEFLLGDSLLSMAKSFGELVIRLADALHMLKPDIVILEGDRYETFAAAVAAAHLGMIIAHLGGGDSCLGGLDESFRHAITKLAHIHFPATEKAKKRIVRMGEREDMVFVVGEPALDVALNAKLPSKEEVCKKLGLDAKKDFMIVLQHPVTTQVEDAAKQMETTLRAVEKFEMQKLLIYPNADAGSRRIIEVIEGYRGKRDFFIVPSVAHEEFLSLLKHAAVLVGNSSSGIIEAPSFKTPVVNVGQRQLGREMAGNVINAGHEEGAIQEAIDTALHDEGFRQRLGQVENPYGDGTASRKIVERLKEIIAEQGDLKKLVQKKITY